MEVNSTRIAGPVTWFQDWAPKPGRESWGGTLAFRIQLPQDQIIDPINSVPFTAIGQELFVQAKYKADAIDTPRFNMVKSILDGQMRLAAITEGRIVTKERKDGSKTTFLQTNFFNLQVSDTPSFFELNETQVFGKIVRTHGAWLQVVTKTRNPKTGEYKDHLHTVFASCSTPTKPQENKYALVTGRIATKANGQDLVYTAARNLLVF